MYSTGWESCPAKLETLVRDSKVFSVVTPLSAGHVWCVLDWTSTTCVLLCVVAVANSVMDVLLLPLLPAGAPIGAQDDVELAPVETSNLLTDEVVNLDLLNWQSLFQMLSSQIFTNICQTYRNIFEINICIDLPRLCCSRKLISHAWARMIFEAAF